MRKICLLLVLCLLLSACSGGSTPSETPTPTPDHSVSDGTVDNTDSDTGVLPGDGDSTGTDTVPDGGNSTGADTLPDGGDSTDKDKPANDKEDSSKPECKKHVDAGDDGKCDNCGANVLVIIDFYNINDLHGKLADGDNHPGVDELTTYLKKAKKNDQHSVFLSSGDMWQGAPESNLTQGLIITDWMNHLGFSAMSLGNHEFDWGEDPIAKNSEQAKFPILAINVYDTATDKRVSYCDSSVMISRGGVKIGIIGAIGDCYSSISKDKVSGVYFKTGASLTTLVKNEATKLREQGASYIVYLLHDGYEENNSGTVSSVISSRLKNYYDVELSNGYVDLVFEGHTHKKYILKDEYGVYHMQGGGDNNGLSHIEISINTANGNDKIRYADYITSGKYANMADDPIVEELLNKYSEDVSVGTSNLGTNARQRSSGELCQLVADLYYKKGLELWGDEYDIVLGGGFISARSPYTLPAGDVIYGTLYSIFPFDNNLVLCSIKGRDLQEKFFETDNDRYYISYGDYGKQVKKDIDPNATYYVVVDSYTSVYGPNRLTEITRLDKEYYARDMLADYAKDGGFKK